MKLNKKRKLFVVSLVGTFTFVSAAVAITLVNNEKFNALTAVECEHEGYHYHAKEATFEESGYDEFYVCCKCHEVFLDTPSVGTFLENGSLIGGVKEGHPAYIPVQTNWEDRIMQSGAVFTTYFGGNIKNTPKANRTSGSMSFRIGEDGPGDEHNDVKSYFQLKNNLLKLAKSTGANALAFDFVVDEALFDRVPNHYAAISENVERENGWMVNYDESDVDLTQKQSYVIDLTKYDFDGDSANALYDFYVRDNAYGGYNSVPANITISNLKFVDSVEKMLTSKGAIHNYFSIVKRDPTIGRNNYTNSEITAFNEETGSFTMADCKTFNIGKPFFDLLRNINNFGFASFKMKPNNPSITAFCTIKTTTIGGIAYELEDSMVDGALEVVLSKDLIENAENLEFLWRGYSDSVDFMSQGATFYDFKIVTTDYKNMFDSIDNLKAIFTADNKVKLSLQADLENKVITMSGTHTVAIANSFLASAYNDGKTKFKFHLHIEGEGAERITVVSAGITAEEAEEKGYGPNSWAVGFTAEFATDLDIEIDLNHLVEFPTLYYKLEPQKSDYTGVAAVQVMSNISFE